MARLSQSPSRSVVTLATSSGLDARAIWNPLMATSHLAKRDHGPTTTQSEQRTCAGGTQTQLGIGTHKASLRQGRSAQGRESLSSFAKATTRSLEVWHAQSKVPSGATRAIVAQERPPSARRRRGPRGPWRSERPILRGHRKDRAALLGSRVPGVRRRVESDPRIGWTNRLDRRVR